MLLAKWFELTHGEVTTINLKEDFNLCCGAKRIKVWANAMMYPVSPDVTGMCIPLSANTYTELTFPVIKGKSPNSFKFYNSQTSNKNICFIIEEIGGVADENYFDE